FDRGGRGAALQLASWRTVLVRQPRLPSGAVNDRDGLRTSHMVSPRQARMRYRFEPGSTARFDRPVQRTRLASLPQLAEEVRPVGKLEEVWVPGQIRKLARR